MMNYAARCTESQSATDQKKKGDESKVERLKALGLCLDIIIEVRRSEIEQVYRVVLIRCERSRHLLACNKIECGT